MNRFYSYAARGIASLAVLLLTMGLVTFGPPAIRTGFDRWSPDGLTVSYYRGKDFRKLVCRRGERHVFMDYGEQRPAMGVSRNNFSARWEGWLLAPSNAVYTFFSQSEDGIRLHIDNETIIDNWRENDWRTSAAHGQAALTAGPHRLTIEHFNATGPAALRVRWTGGGIPENSLLSTPWLRKRKP